MEYHAVCRDADLTYLATSDVVVTEKKDIQINFQFMKNDQSGTYGVIKIARLIDMGNFLTYHKEAVTAQWEQLFPQKYDAFLASIRTVLGQSVGTRGFRRGAAVQATTVANPSTMKAILAHKGEGTQRTYTRKLTAIEEQQQRQVQDCLHQQHQHPPIADNTVHNIATTHTNNITVPHTDKSLYNTYSSMHENMTTTTNPRTLTRPMTTNLTLIPDTQVASSLLAMAQRAARSWAEIMDVPE
jgi:hypothetical protein